MSRGYTTYKVSGIDILIDLEDIDKINKYKWYVSYNVVRICNGLNTMARVLMDLPPYKQYKKKVNFLNGDSFDLRKENLYVGRKIATFYYTNEYAYFMVGNDSRVIIDKEYVDIVKKYHWKLTQKGYVYTKINKDNSSLYLHKYLINYVSGREIDEADHQDKNKLNNRIENLRECTRSQNQQNQLKRTDREYTSKYKGVDWRDNQWRCRITANKIRVLIGYFDNEEAAGNAYNYCAKILHKEFACYNDVELFMEKEEWESHMSDILIANVKNKHGATGVKYNKRNNKKWQSRIAIDGVTHYLGSFYTKEEAVQAYNNALKQKREVIIGEMIENNNLNDITWSEYCNIIQN